MSFGTSKNLYRKNNRANLAAEVSLLIVIIVAACGWIFYYLKGAVCERWKESTESVLGHVQYDQGNTTIIKE